MATFDDIPANIAVLIDDHTRLYLEDPAKAHLWDARPVGVPGFVPTLLLTVVGRKSGAERHVPLLYHDHAGGYLIVGSKGGNRSHPAWYLNLVATPDCQVRVGAPPVKARARVLSGTEHDDAWTIVSTKYPVYQRYQQRTDRQIPLVLIEPAGRK